MPYDEHSRRTMLRSHPVAGRGRALRNPAGQLPGTVPAALETGSGTAHAFQPQVAVGAGRIYRADHRCVRHTHARASRGNAPRRSRCDGISLFYRELLDGAHSRRCVLFFARRLAQGKTVRNRPLSADEPVRGAGQRLLGTLRLAGVAKSSLERAVTESPTAHNNPHTLV